jgi:hypothetical protein
MKTAVATTFDAMTTLPMETSKQARASRFCDELQLALSRLDGNSLKAWGVRSSERLFTLTGRGVDREKEVFLRLNQHVILAMMQ